MYRKKLSLWSRLLSCSRTRYPYSIYTPARSHHVLGSIFCSLLMHRSGSCLSAWLNSPSVFYSVVSLAVVSVVCQAGISVLDQAGISVGCHTVASVVGQAEVLVLGQALLTVLGQGSVSQLVRWSIRQSSHLYSRASAPHVIWLSVWDVVQV